jgi:hypothetical protein
MANTVFKGDLAEVSFGHEVGLRGNGTGAAAGFAVATSGNTCTITLGDNAQNVWRTKIPDNILIGCVLRIYDPSGALNSDDFSSTRRSFYITGNDTTNNTITIQPGLASADGNAPSTSYFVIDNYQCPTFDGNMTDHATTGFIHRVLTDQFIGLLNEFSLPEPEIDVRKQHVIGLGRDVNVITSGRETLSGGSLQLNAHSLRWMKYALGGHTARSQGSLSTTIATANSISEKPFNLADDGSKTGRAELRSTSSTTGEFTTIGSSGTVFTGGDTLDTALGTSAVGNDCLIGIDVASVADAGAGNVVMQDKTVLKHINANGGVLKVNSNGTTLYASYTGISSQNLSGIADIDSGAKTAAVAANKCIVLLAPLSTALSIGDTRVHLHSDLRASFSVGDYIQIIDNDPHTIPSQDDTPATIRKHEIRRVIAVPGSGEYIYVDEPFLFNHAINSCGIDRLRYTGTNAKGSPHILSSTKELQNGVEHTFFGHNTLPSFTIEQSFRSSDATPGAKQLLRLYSGCKVSEATMSADTEGELKLEASYDAARHYTDTGDGTTLPAFNPHRMFENTAATTTNRKVSGIATDGEKPYLFQDISIQAFGRPVLRATEFSISISNNTTAQWFIRGYEGQTQDAHQVQHGGTQTPMDITEAAREYTFTFKAMIEDERLWEELRTRRHHKNTNDITFSVNKAGSAATRQNATITLEDYTITKADHQVPSDKGPVYADIELVVRHMKIVENNPYYSL